MRNEADCVTGYERNLTVFYIYICIIHIMYSSRMNKLHSQNTRWPFCYQQDLVMMWDFTLYNMSERTST